MYEFYKLWRESCFILHIRIRMCCRISTRSLVHNVSSSNFKHMLTFLYEKYILPTSNKKIIRTDKIAIETRLMQPEAVYAPFGFVLEYESTCFNICVKNQFQLRRPKLGIATLQTKQFEWTTLSVIPYQGKWREKTANNASKYGNYLILKEDEIVFHRKK